MLAAPQLQLRYHFCAYFRATLKARAQAPFPFDIELVPQEAQEEVYGQTHGAKKRSATTGRHPVAITLKVNPALASRALGSTRLLS